MNANQTNCLNWLRSNSKSVSRMFHAQWILNAKFCNNLIFKIIQQQTGKNNHNEFKHNWIPCATNNSIELQNSNSAINFKNFWALQKDVASQFELENERLDFSNWCAWKFAKLFCICFDLNVAKLISVYVNHCGKCWLVNNSKFSIFETFPLDKTLKHALATCQSKEVIVSKIFDCSKVHNLTTDSCKCCQFNFDDPWWISRKWHWTPFLSANGKWWSKW